MLDNIFFMLGDLRNFWQNTHPWTWPLLIYVYKYSEIFPFFTLVKFRMLKGIFPCSVLGVESIYPYLGFWPSGSIECRAANTDIWDPLGSTLNTENTNFIDQVLTRLGTGLHQFS